MSSYFYGKQPNYINESIKDSAMELRNNIVNLSKLKNEWKGIADKFVKNKWVYRYIKSEDEETKLKKWYDIITNTEDYQEYKRVFKNLANYFGLPAEQIIIEWLTFEKSKNAEPDRACLRYSKGLVKVKIPKGVSLIHTSPISDIKSLVPSFRSKTKGKFFYPSKRVFFTVAKDINPRKNGTQNTKLTKYVTKQEFTDVYIDPTYTSFMDGSVMIITDKPIPVDKYESKLSKLFGAKKVANESSVEEVIKGTFEYTPMIQELVECMDYDEELLDETSFKEFLEMLKNWHTANDKHMIQEFKSSNVSDDDYNMLKGLLEEIKSATNMTEYRKPFDAFCKFCNILPNNVILTKYELTKGKDNKNSILVRYSHNNKPIKIPEGIKLYHFSKVPNISALEPQFRGKSERGYLYDRPRVYLTINPHMPKIAADYTKIKQKIYKYEVTKSISDVYVDPLIWNVTQGAVYVVGNSKIPVKDVTNEKPESLVKSFMK